MLEVLMAFTIFAATEELKFISSYRLELCLSLFLEWTKTGYTLLANMPMEAIGIGLRRGGHSRTKGRRRNVRSGPE